MPDRFASTDSPITIACPVALTTPVRTLSTRPMLPAVRCRRTAAIAGLPRSCRPITSCTPATFATSAISALSAAPRPSGHSLYVLAGGGRGEHQRAVVGHPRRDGDDVDLRIGDQRLPVVIGLADAERVRRLVGRLPAVGGDRGELEAGQHLHRRHVRLARPAAARVRAVDANPQIFAHAIVLQSVAAEIASLAETILSGDQPLARGQSAQHVFGADDRGEFL